MHSRVLLILLGVAVLLTLFSRRLPAKVGFTRHRDTVLSGSVRFQVLSKTLLRLEYSSQKRFTDDPTIIVTQRNWPAVRFNAREEAGWLIISGSNFMLRYQIGSGRFTGKNLYVSWRYCGYKGSWAPGDTDKENLGGISYSLDGASGARLPRLQAGLLSKNGYFLLDDSRTPVLKSSSRWIAPRKDDADQDFYLFIYGHDYPHVLKDFSELSGRIPMVPRYAFGIWMTDLNYEYLTGTDIVTNYHFTDSTLTNEINRFRSEGLPLDVLVLDFAWHNYGWEGGYDWSPIFSNPDSFLNWAHNNGLHVAVNDHPGYGGESVLSNRDSRASEIRRLLHLSATQKPTYVLNIADNWKFRLDPQDSGARARWYAMDFGDSSWENLEGGRPWEEQGHPGYDGFAWYRKWVALTNELPKHLYAVFGGVDDEYDLYINGKKVAHHGLPGNSVYNSVTYTDITSSIERGRRNLIAVRVNDWGGNGGLTALPIELDDVLPPSGIKFNLADKRQAEIFMNVLHAPVMRDGVDFWWVDGGSGSCHMEGLNSQLWTNKVFYDFTQQYTKKRGFIFSRYGGWGNQRYPAFFTGDTHSEWPVLAFEVRFTAQGGNVLMPYITHDIGGFLGDSLSVDMYARWLEFGAFSPFLRLHCAFENPVDGNMRMPWVYGKTGVEVAKKFFNLREQLIPYIYTYSRITYEGALPLVRPLYLEYPELDKAYHYPNEYFFGSEFLVSPAVDSTDTATVYLPPGNWVDYFTGKKYNGDQVTRAKYSLDSMPLFVKQGSIIPMQSLMTYSCERSLDTLIVQVFGPDSGRFNLYEDDGYSLDYTDHNYSWTPISFSGKKNGEYRLSIGPTDGKFEGQVGSRAYTIQIHGLAKPSEIKLNNNPVILGESNGSGWMWDSNKSTIVISVPLTGIRQGIELTIK